MGELFVVCVSTLSVCGLALVVEWCSLTAVGGEDIWYLSVRHAAWVKQSITGGAAQCLHSFTIVLLSPTALTGCRGWGHSPDSIHNECMPLMEQ